MKMLKNNNSNYLVVIAFVYIARLIRHRLNMRMRNVHNYGSVNDIHPFYIHSDYIFCHLEDLQMIKIQNLQNTIALTLKSYVHIPDALYKKRAFFIISSGVSWSSM